MPAKEQSKGENLKQSLVVGGEQIQSLSTPSNETDSQMNIEVRLLRSLLVDPPKLESDLKLAYAEGKTSEEERELVEAAMELDPRLKSEVLELQETVRFINSPEAKALIDGLKKDK